MTITVFGIALPRAAERAYRAGRALAEAEDIAVGSQALINFLAGWLENNPGDRACVTTVADFLDDYYHERQQAAADGLGIDCAEIAEERRAALEKLARGERGAELECDVCQHVRPLNRVVAYGIETYACDECLGRESCDLAVIEKLARGER